MGLFDRNLTKVYGTIIVELKAAKGIYFMKKRIFSALLCLSLCIAVFISCGKNKDKGNTDSNLIFDENTELSLVYSGSDVDRTLVQEIYKALEPHMEKQPKITLDTEAAASHEIVLGNTNRDISAQAYKRLSRIDKDTDMSCTYVIYSDGSSVAIAYEDDAYGVHAAANTVVEYFVSTYLTGGSLNLKSGTVYSGSIDIINYQQKLDDIYVEERWAVLAASVDEKYSEGVVAGLQKIYALYTDDVISWFANLYDPAVGGWYYSNSARDTEGYLPDAESTRQALNFMSGSGLADSVGGEYTAVVPDWMREQIIAFIKGLQNPNGYFYHPQWGKEFTDQYLSRRSRDLKWCTYILEDFDVKPTYDTPNGYEGDGIKADGTPVSYKMLTGRLGTSVTKAVAKVTATASSGDNGVLESDVTFKAYLASLDLRNDSYKVGNDLSSMVGEILARDKELARDGAGYSLADIAIEWFNENQNPETGTWDEKYDYHATNGLMKISCFYDDVGAVFPNADAAVRSALYSMTTDEDPYNVCCIYNNWFTINNIINILRGHGGSEGEAMVKKIREDLYAQAAESLSATASKIALFLKDDGSFSYKQTMSSPTSQSMPAAVPNTNEGDVNATNICIDGTINNIYAALGLASVKVPIYTEADMIRYLSILNELGPVIKDEDNFEVSYITFDEDTVGKEPLDIGYTINSDGHVEVVEDPRVGVSGNVLELVSYSASKGDALTVACDSSSLGANCYVFEGDFCVTSADEKYIVQITMGEAYMLALKVSGGKVNVWDSSSNGSNRMDTELGISPQLGEWFNIRAEYYPGDHDTVRIKVYYNDVLTAVTDNYFDSAGKKIDTGTGTPKKSFSEVEILVMSSRNCTMLLDDLACYTKKQSYEPVISPTEQLYYNVDAPDKKELVYTFDEVDVGKNYPEDFSVSENGDSFEVKSDTSGNKYLAISGTAGAGIIDIPANIRTSGSNCAIIEADMLYSSAEVGATLGITLRENNSIAEDIACYYIAVREEAGEKYIALIEAPDGNAGAELEGIRLSVGESFKLGIEYYEDARATLVYINGELLAMSSRLCTDAAKLRFGKLQFTNEATSNADIQIDNLKIEKNKKSFEDATQPTVDRVVHSFTSAIGSSGIKVPVNNRSVVLSANILETLVKVTGGDDGGAARIAVTDDSGNIIYALDLVAVGNDIELHEHSVSGTHTLALASFKKGAEATLAMEYYPAKDILHIYLDGKAVAVTSIAYSEESADLKASFATVGLLGTASVYVSSLVAESYNKLYIPVNADGANDEDTAEKVTFDTSTTGNIPKRATASLVSQNSALKIKESKIGDTYSKVLAFDTATGGNDELYINVTKSPAAGTAYNSVIFESKIYLDLGSISSGKHQYHLYFGTAKETAYQLRIVEETDGTIHLRDHNGSSQGFDKSIGKTEHEWFTLRVELYFVSSTEFHAVIYADGSLVAVSENYYGSSLIKAVSQVKFYTMTAMNATIMLDDASLEQTTQAYSAPGAGGGSDSGEEIPAEPVSILPIKGGASGIVVLMHDDGDITSARLLDEIYEEYGLRGDIAMIASRVYDTATGTPDMLAVNAWQQILDTGRWNITSHSLTHQWWGLDDSSGMVTNEVVSSQTILRNLFAGQRVRAFAYPGFTAQVGEYGEDACYSIAKELVDQYYVVGRHSEGCASSLTDIDWTYISAESIGMSYLNTTLATIDEAAGGKMAVIFMHNVCEDTDSPPESTVTVSHMTEIAKKLSGYVSDGSVWNAYLEEAAMYLREAECASISAYDITDEKITVTLTDSLDNSLFDFPLTVRIEAPAAWEAAMTVQGERTSYAIAKYVSGRWVIDAEIVPDGGEAVITPIQASDIPEDSEVVTPPADTDPDKLTFENNYTASGDGSLALSNGKDGGFSVTVTKNPEDEGDNVLSETALAIKDNKHIYVDSSAVGSAVGDYYIFETDMYLSSKTDGALLAAAASFMTLDFRVDSSNIFYTVNFRRIRTNKDTPEESRGLILTPKDDTSTYLNKNAEIAYDTWVKFAVELYLDTETGIATVKFYVNGTVLCTHTAELPDTLTATAPTRIDLKYIKETTSLMYFDDISYKRSETPYIVFPESITFEKSTLGDEDASSVDGTLKTDTSANDSSYSTTVESFGDTENKVLHVVNTATGNKHVNIDSTAVTSVVGNCYILETRIYIDSFVNGELLATGEGAIIEIDFRYDGKPLYVFGLVPIEVTDADGNITRAISIVGRNKSSTYPSNGNLLAMAEAVIPCDAWVNLRVEFYRGSSSVSTDGNGAAAPGADDTTVTRILVDGEIACEDRTVMNVDLVNGTDIPTRVDIKFIKNVHSSVYLDDINFERTEDTYTAAESAE